MIVGQDAPITHSSGLFGGAGSSQDIDLEQAFVDFNIPIGNGLKITFGKTVTPMGVEVIEEVSNPNFSEGNQFWYVENFTQTGVQFAYQWSPKIDTEFYIFNGWDALPDNNTTKSFMGRIGIAINDKNSLALVGYGGCEQAADNHDWRTGVNVVYNTHCSDKLNLWLQGDYGHEDNAPMLDGGTTANADWYAAGAWVTYDFTDKVELALRADYIKDEDDVRLPVGTTPVTGPNLFSSRPKELYGWTATLNYKPLANLQIRPELRWDRSESPTSFNGKRDQMTAAMGVAYLF